MQRKKIEEKKTIKMNLIIYIFQFKKTTTTKDSI